MANGTVTTESLLKRQRNTKAVEVRNVWLAMATVVDLPQGLEVMVAAAGDEPEMVVASGFCPSW